MTAIFKRELRSYFTGMTGYVFISIMLLFAGLFITGTSIVGGNPRFENSLISLIIVLLMIVPILTMRAFSEERHLHTDKLLYFLPIKLSGVVIGKYLAMVSVFAIPTAIIGTYPLILSIFGKISFLTAYTSLLGFFLLGCSLIAICMFVSTFTESQVIAAVLGFAVLLLIYFMNALASFLPATHTASFLALIILFLLIAVILYFLAKDALISVVAAAVGIIPISTVYLLTPEAFVGLFPKIISYLAVFDRIDRFVYGVFDITAVVYYLSIIVFSVFLTLQVMEKRRWA